MIHVYPFHAELEGIESVNIVARFGACHDPLDFKIHGSCEVRLEGECADLRRLVVDPALRRRGIGKALLLEAVNCARIHRKLSLVFTVEKTNLEALAFYEAVGAQCFYASGESFWYSVIIHGRPNGGR